MASFWDYWIPWGTAAAAFAGRADAVDRSSFAGRAKALQVCLKRWVRRERQAVARKDRAGADLARRRQVACRGLLLALERAAEGGGG
jgi:hypothetical protein